MPMDGLTPQSFLVLAVETATRLQWNINYLSHGGMIAVTGTGMFQFRSRVTMRISNDAVSITSESLGNEMADWGKNKKKVLAFINEFSTVRQQLSAEEINLRFESLQNSIVPDEHDYFRQPQPSSSDEAKGVLYIFVPTKGYFITPLLADINILIFILMALTGVSIMTPENSDLLKWGANFRPLTLSGEWWRLITGCFLHIGVMHLLMNMYALLFIGVLLEPYLGSLRFTVAYLLTGVAASTTSLFWHQLTISAGASGAIFGLYGVFLAMLTSNIIEKKTRKPLLLSIGFFVVYNLGYGMQGGIDNAAHIGGLISGLVIGYALIPSLKRPGSASLRFITLSILSVIILSSSAYVYKHTSNDIARYDAVMDELSNAEIRALEIYKLPSDTPREKYMSAVKDSGIYYWNKSLALLNGLDKLDIPDVLRKKSLTLKKYCQLRLSTYNLLYKSADEDTDQYDTAIEEYDKQIDSVLKELKAGEKQQ